MSGKQHKRDLKREREAARLAARRAERQRTLFTLIVIGVIVAIGGGLIFFSLFQEGEIFAEPTEPPTPTATEPTADDRAVACGAAAPATAGAPKPTFTEPPETVLEDGIDYEAVIETSCGTVRMDLFADRAPETVNSFVFLAQQGFFDGLEIFRNATTIGALQTGAGTDDNSFQIGYMLPDELAIAEADGYPPGTVAMAKSQAPDSAGSQFFFVYNEGFDAAFADNRVYSVFGMVTEGLEVLQQMGAIAVEGEAPTELLYMDSVTVQPAGATPTGTPTTTPTTTATDAPATDAPATDAPTTDAPATPAPTPTG